MLPAFHKIWNYVKLTQYWPQTVDSSCEQVQYMFHVFLQQLVWGHTEIWKSEIFFQTYFHFTNKSMLFSLAALNKVIIKILKAAPGVSPLTQYCDKSVAFLPGEYETWRCEVAASASDIFIQSLLFNRSSNDLGIYTL